MSDQNYRASPVAGAQTGAVIDQGLRSFMLRVYNYMLLGLALTGGVAALAVSYQPFLELFFTVSGYSLSPTILGWVAIFSPVIFALVFGFGINRMSAGTAQILFWVFASIMGISMATLAFAYTGESIARVFFITAATFGAMSLYGYTTKRDLSTMGSFLMMGLFGLIIAMVVNLFLQSSALQFAISVIGVLIFVGLTAWDTQKIKESYSSVSADGQMMAKAAVIGALNLYLDFINLFMFLLRLLGDRR